MLVLARKVDDVIEITVGDTLIKVVICGISGELVQVGVDAPRNVKIMRTDAKKRS